MSKVTSNHFPRLIVIFSCIILSFSCSVLLVYNCCIDVDFPLTRSICASNPGQDTVEDFELNNFKLNDNNA